MLRLRSEVGNLLFAKRRSVFNSAARTGWGLKPKVLLITLMGLSLLSGIFLISYWFLDQCQQVEVFGDLIVEQLLAITFLVVFGLLIFSNLVSSFSTYFLAKDLDLLMTSPLEPESFFGARFVELFIQSSWMVGLFSLPVFISIGLVYDVGIDYYVNLIALLIPLFAIATAIASIFGLLITSLLPAKRTRDVLIMLGVITFVVLFVLFRSLRPERFFNPDEQTALLEVMSTFSAPRSWLLPSEWAQRTLWPIISGERTPRLLYLASLHFTALGLFFVGCWIFRAFHFDGFTKASEGRMEGSAPERIFRWILRRKHDVVRGFDRRLSALRRSETPLALTVEMRRKDAKTFIRDASQWTQLILLAALIVIYLLNFKYIQAVEEGGIIGPVALYSINLGLSGFVISAISVRFVFPAVSLEGRAFWLIKSAPVDLLTFLKSKWVSIGLAIWAFGSLLVITSNLLLDVRIELHVLSLMILTAVAVGVVGLGIGLGAIYPNFNSDNAAKIATGFGGFFYMFVGLGITLSSVILAAYPSYVLTRVVDPSSSRTFTSFEIGLAVGLCCLGLALPVVVGWAAVRLGARHLERRE